VGGSGEETNVKYTFIFLILGGLINVLTNFPFFRSGQLGKSLSVILIQMTTSLVLSFIFDVFYFYTIPSGISSFGCLIVVVSSLWSIFTSEEKIPKKAQNSSLSDSKENMQSKSSENDQKDAQS